MDHFAEVCKKTQRRNTEKNFQSFENKIDKESVNNMQNKKAK